MKYFNWVLIPGGRLLRHGGEYVEKYRTLAVSVPVNPSIKLGYASVNGPRETYFVDALCSFRKSSGGRRVSGIFGSLIWSKTLMELTFNSYGEFR